MYTKEVKNMIVLFSIILFAILLFRAFRSHNDNDAYDFMEKCMGIPVISEEQFSKMAKKSVELDNIACLDGKLTPYDRNSKRIYISCDVTEAAEFYMIPGQIKSDSPGYELFFIKENAFQNMPEAVRKGDELMLAAVNASGHYCVYHVIFTTLPVVEIHGAGTRIDERDRDIYCGEINVWNQSDRERDAVTTSRLEWKVRGNTAMVFPKKSYKLSLKDKKGQKENVSLLGMESDDDYILNPMWLDDLKIREKLAISLWNEIAEERNSNLRMSNAEYCELVINEEYRGLYLLQNRIEKKSLKLDENAILFKGNNIDPTEDHTSEDVFEIVYSKKDLEDTYRAMDSFLHKTDFSNVDLENWTDLQLFLHLGDMNDNRRYKNMYYVIEEQEGRQTLRFLPWDTDMSFGIAWSDGFAYIPESFAEIYNRVEYDKILEQYPKLEAMLAERWKILRETVFSEEHLSGIIDSYDKELKDSGALDRDFAVFGHKAWDGQDTRQNLDIYIKKRLEILDQKYGLL